jgi:hypothetical protein
VQPLDLEINGSAASSQTVQNLENSATVTVTDNGSGNISFTAAAGGIPTPDQAQWRLWEAASYSNLTFNGYGETIAITDSGASSGYNAATSTTGGSFYITTTSNEYRYYLGALFAYPSGRATTFKAIMTPSLSNAAAKGNIRFGLSDSAGTSEISFYTVNTGTGWSNWKILTYVSSTPTYTDTGVAVSFGTRTKFSFSVSAGGVISWNIGASSGTASPTIASSPAGLFALVQSSASSYNATGTFEYLYGTNATP